MINGLRNSIYDIDYKKTDNIFIDSKSIIESARNCAYTTVNISLIKRNWLIGKRISEEWIVISKRLPLSKSIWGFLAATNWAILF